jgi:hypothetical protein
MKPPPLRFFRSSFDSTSWTFWVLVVITANHSWPDSVVNSAARSNANCATCSRDMPLAPVYETATLPLSTGTER